MRALGTPGCLPEDHRGGDNLCLSCVATPGVLDRFVGANVLVTGVYRAHAPFVIETIRLDPEALEWRWR